MNVAPFSAQFSQTQPLVSTKNGTPSTAAYAFLNSLLKRTGGGTGIVNSVSGPLTATGSSVIDALPLSNDWNLVTTTPSGSGVILPTTLAGSATGGAALGATCKVRNNGAHTLSVYPPNSSFQINALGAGNAYSLASGDEIEFECWTTTQLYTR